MNHRANLENGNQLLKPQTRARVKVMRFLEDQCRDGNAAEGERLPASRVLARHLEVSLTTVQNVYRQLATEGIVRTEQGNGSFWKLPLLHSPSKTLRIGLSFGRSEGMEQSGPWSTAISGAVTQAAACSRRPISIHPVAVPSFPPEDVLGALRKQDGKIDAMILHPVLEGREILSKESDLSFPIVHLNPGFATSLTNFVSADFYGISQTLGQTWAKTGRSHILFVHNSGDKMNAAAALRCAGLVAGLGNRIGNGIDLRIITADPHSEESGYALAKECLHEAGAMPDAIYLVGDSLAVGYCRYLHEHGVNIPDEVSVVSGGGVSEPRAPFRDLTRARQPADKIGETLLDMAFHLAEGEAAEVPGKFIPCAFIGGQTTTQEENRLLDTVPL